MSKVDAEKVRLVTGNEGNSNRAETNENIEGRYKRYRPDRNPPTAFEVHVKNIFAELPDAPPPLCELDDTVMFPSGPEEGAPLMPWTVVRAEKAHYLLELPLSDGKYRHVICSEVYISVYPTQTGETAVRWSGDQTPVPVSFGAEAPSQPVAAEATATTVAANDNAQDVEKPLSVVQQTSAAITEATQDAPPIMREEAATDAQPDIPPIVAAFKADTAIPPEETAASPVAEAAPIPAITPEKPLAANDESFLKAGVVEETAPAEITGKAVESAPAPSVAANDTADETPPIMTMPSSISPAPTKPTIAEALAMHQATVAANDNAGGTTATPIEGTTTAPDTFFMGNQPPIPAANDNAPDSNTESIESALIAPKAAANDNGGQQLAA